MPLARIEIEQIGHDRWIARLETGSLTSRQAAYTGPTLDFVTAAAVVGYYELSGVSRTDEATVEANKMPPRVEAFTEVNGLGHEDVIRITDQKPPTERMRALPPLRDRQHG